MSKQMPRGKEYAKLLLVTIREVRDEHHACTLRDLARRLGGVNHNQINRQFDVLRNAGLVDATQMPGSIHLTPLGEEVAAGAEMPWLATQKVAARRVRAFRDAPPEVEPEASEVETITAGEVEMVPAAAWFRTPPPPPPPAA